MSLTDSLGVNSAKYSLIIRICMFLCVRWIVDCKRVFRSEVRITTLWLIHPVHNILIYILIHNE